MREPGDWVLLLFGGLALFAAGVMLVFFIYWAIKEWRDET